ncbi:hypothetical protein L218DRAFT_134024 [Marasmius fiardii PR-910]|nr:hypothetical protein L218DRAFT_134024 [Marasmius fiardii PR-910]
MSWLSQSYHIFNMLDIPKEEWPGCGYHYAVELYLEQPSFPGCNRDGDFDSLAADQTPCYLFLFPPPQIHDGSPDVDAWTSGRNLYYYSFDPDGQSALSDSQRVSLGLPSFITDAVQSASGWSSDVYELIRAWQEVKGFNPNTTDFARSLGLPIMEVMSLNEDWERFEVLSGNSGSRVSVVDEARDGAMDVDLPMCSPHLSQNASLDGPTYNSFIDPVLSKSESLVLVDADMMEVD